MREQWLLLLEADPRKGRRQLASSLRKRELRREARLARWRDLSDFDRDAASGLILAGVDEVGRGPLAGPVTAGAVILPPGYSAPGLDDSKKMTAAAREQWAARLRADALGWAVADVAAGEIDRRGIKEAVFQAMADALRALAVTPQIILIDGNEVPRGSRKSRAVIGGDGKSLSIAAASVLAKVHRDGLMREYAEQWPGYGFAGNKGYGSAEHQAALLELGPCPLHRRSFCGRWLSQTQGESRRQNPGSSG
ncbi:MAG: ribonuclease HII [bacterium]|nr:ribonuclease HII [bacterium]